MMSDRPNGLALAASAHWKGKDNVPKDDKAVPKSGMALAAKALQERPVDKPQEPEV